MLGGFLIDEHGYGTTLVVTAGERGGEGEERERCFIFACFRSLMN